MSTFRVFPNPWAALDKSGVPCGVCPRDPVHDGGGPGQFVGARVDRKHTEILQKLEPGDDMRSPLQRTRYEYMGVASNDPALAEKLSKAEPVVVPASKYYRDRIAEGSLLCADAETAQAAKAKRFVPPAEFFKRFMPAVAVKAPEPKADPSPKYRKPSASTGADS